MRTICFASVVLGLTLLRLEGCDCYRILGVFPFNGRSHFMMFETLMKGLASKGHQVDVISTFPLKNPPPNYTDIIELPLLMPVLVNNMTYRAITSWSTLIVHWISTDIGNNLCNALGHLEMQKLIRNPPKDPPYDLVITEFLAANCFIALGHHLKIPTIGIISSALYPWNHRIIANPANLAFVASNTVGYESPMNFWGRMFNTVNANINDLYFRYLTSSQDELIRKYFGEDAPGVREVEKTLALVLTNSHCSVNGPKPVTSAVIEVGGLHIQDDGPQLSEDLKKWMDDSTDGFVYFTFGSMVKIESFPKNIVQTFYKSLEKISPIRVLMKVPNPEQLPPGLPKNFRTFKWATQLKVLKHKNVKAFITHGGLMGTLEAIHCAVPMLAIPLFADQFTNADLCTEKKIALKVNYHDITEKKMDETLNAILYDPAYKDRMLEISAEFHDRPMRPIDTAIWWIEYVIRHGSQDLKSPGLDLHWWQIELFDVYAMFLLILALLVYVTTLLTQFLIRRFFAVRNFVRVTKAKKVK